MHSRARPVENRELGSRLSPPVCGGGKLVSEQRSLMEISVGKLTRDDDADLLKDKSESLVFQGAI